MNVKEVEKLRNKVEFEVINGNGTNTHLQSKKKQHSKGFNEVVWPMNRSIKTQREEKVNQSLQRSREDNLWEPKGGIHWSPKVAPSHEYSCTRILTLIESIHKSYIHWS